MYQVALGMEYLEGIKIVHRNLAARNVVLVSEEHAKIAGFSMSKALDFDQEYYQVSPTLHLTSNAFLPRDALVHSMKRRHKKYAKLCLSILTPRALRS